MTTVGLLTEELNDKEQKVAEVVTKETLGRDAVVYMSRLTGGG